MAVLDTQTNNLDFIFDKLRRITYYISIIIIMRNLVLIKLALSSVKVNTLTFNCVVYNTNTLHTDCTEDLGVS